MPEIAVLNAEFEAQRDADRAAAKATFELLNTKDQANVNTKVNAFEARLTTRYNALDRQMSTLNGLNAYISQQVTNWNKSKE